MAGSLKDRFSRKTPGFFLWWAVVLVLLLGLIFLYAQAWQREKHESQWALAHNQRVRITLEGQVEGAATPSTSSITPPAPPENPPEVPAVELPATSPAEPGQMPAVPSAKIPKPSITLIITGLGLNHAAFEEANKLPPAVAFSFSPYAAETETLAATAKNSGRELLADIPIEPRDGHSDAGPHALLSSAAADANLTNLEWVMSHVPGAVGVFIPRDEALSMRGDALTPVFNALASHHLYTVYGGSDSNAVWGGRIKILPGETAAADIIVDEDLSAAAVDGALADLERLARIHDHVIAIGHAYPVTIRQVDQWAAKLADKGTTLVPLSSFLQAQKTEADEAARSAAEKAAKAQEK